MVSLDIPELELDNTAVTDSQSFKGFHSTNPEWFNGTNIVNTILSRNASQFGMDFDYISTPETSYGIVFSYDSQNPQQPPINAHNYMKDVYGKICDTMNCKKNYDDAVANKAFLKAIQNGIRNYRYTMFYEDSHGSPGHIQIGATDDEMKETLSKVGKSGKGRRVFGIYCSCYSGSMLNFPKIGDTPNYMKSKGFGAENWWDDIQFQPSGWDKRQKTNTTPPTEEPGDGKGGVITLWSCTTPSYFGWYTPRNSEDLIDTIQDVLKIYGDKRNINMINESKSFWYQTIKRERAYHRYKDGNGWTIPWLWTWEANHNAYHKVAYLFPWR